MEEQKAGSGSPPVPVNASRRPYSDEHKASILKALVTWKGSRRAFCQLQGIHPATLSVWQTQQIHPSKLQSKPKRYNPDQRRQAVEGFLKAGLSFARFSQVWGVNTRCLMRWVAAYRKGSPKALEDQRGKHRLGKPLASGLLDAVKQVRLDFPSFGLRKLSAFLERFKGVKASPRLVRKALDLALQALNKGWPRASRGGRTANQLERGCPTGGHGEAEGSSTGGTRREITERTKGLRGRALRRETRETIFSVLCRFGLAERGVGNGRG